MSNKEKLKEYREKAHEEFDKLWKLKFLTREAAYRWLSYYMNTHRKKTHFSKFSLKQCQRVIKIVHDHFNDFIKTNKYLFTHEELPRLNSYKVEKYHEDFNGQFVIYTITTKKFPEGLQIHIDKCGNIKIIDIDSQWIRRSKKRRRGIIINS